MVSSAQKRATAKYEQKKYDKILLRVDKDIIKDYANKQGESVNSYIKKAIFERIKRENNA
jgi:predicted HicB family RNase H-like nuclease